MQATVPAAELTLIMSEVLAGRGIGLAQASKLFPPYRPGRGTHAATLTRWIQRGVRGLDGQLHKLDAVRCGSRWITTPGAVERFLASQQQHSEPVDRPATDRTPKKRNAAAEAAVAELERMGA